MLDSKHVKVVWGGQPRQLGHVVSTDSRRRVYTPSFTVTQPLVRRASLDSSAILRTRTLSVKRESSSIVQSQTNLHRAQSLRDVIVRDSPLRKQPTVPVATKLTHEVDLKPILKSGKGSYALPAADDKSSEESRKQASVGPDGKFCYKLPDKPATKLRKTVSFKDDMISSRKTSFFKRNFRSPVLSIPKNVLKLDRDDGQIFV